jgi:hypothetical protein
MPATYDDPTAAVPAVPRVDYRPQVHTLEISREAVDAIAAADAHIRALGTYYGRDSDTYLDAVESWHRHLSHLFALGFGAHTRISRDDDLSLFVHTACGLVYAVSLDALGQSVRLGGEAIGGGPLHQRHAQREVGGPGEGMGQQAAQRGPPLGPRFVRHRQLGCVLAQQVVAGVPPRGDLVQQVRADKFRQRRAWVFVRERAQLCRGCGGRRVKAEQTE